MDLMKGFKTMIEDEFDRRYDNLQRKVRDTFDEESARAFFERDVLSDILRYLLDRGMDADTAYHVVCRDAKTLNAEFEDAVASARFGCNL